MSLAAVRTAVGVALAALVAWPAHADVLEIGGGGEARWLSGPKANTTVPDTAAALAEVPADIGLVADDPFANLEGGARYLREQLDRFGGDVEKALAANAGPGRVTGAEGVPAIRETRIASPRSWGACQTRPGVPTRCAH